VLQRPAGPRRPPRSRLRIAALDKASSSASSASRSRRSRRPSPPESHAARARSRASATGSAGATTCNGPLQPFATPWHAVTPSASQLAEIPGTGCDAVRISSLGCRAWSRVLRAIPRRCAGCDEHGSAPGQVFGAGQLFGTGHRPWSMQLFGTGALRRLGQFVPVLNFYFGEISIPANCQTPLLGCRSRRFCCLAEERNR
jgi:hypothetical protein